MEKDRKPVVYRRQLDKELLSFALPSPVLDNGNVAARDLAQLSPTNLRSTKALHAQVGGDGFATPEATVHQQKKIE